MEVSHKIRQSTCMWLLPGSEYRVTLHVNRPNTTTSSRKSKRQLTPKAVNRELIRSILKCHNGSSRDDPHRLHIITTMATHDIIAAVGLCHFSHMSHV